MACVGLLALSCACVEDHSQLTEEVHQQGAGGVDGHVQEALNHLRAGRYPQAVEASERGLSVDSTHAELNNLLASGEAAQGRYALAISAIERALRHDPEYALGHLNFGGIHFKLGRFDLAERSLLEAARLQPDHSSVHRRLGEIYLATDRPDEAVTRMRRALELFPDDATLTFYLGRALEDSGHHELAEALYARAVELDIGFSEACYRLSVLARRRGNTTLADSALARFQHLQQIGSGDPDVANLVPKQLKKLRAAVLDAPENASHHFRLAVFFGEHGYHPESLNRFRRVAALQPGGTRLLNDIGRALTRQRQLGSALEFYTSAAKADTTRVEALINAGSVLAMQGRPAESIPYYERALRLSPDMPVVQYLYGQALLHSGRDAEGLRVLRAGLAATVDPSLQMQIRKAIASVTQEGGL